MVEAINMLQDATKECKDIAPRFLVKNIEQSFLIFEMNTEKRMDKMPSIDAVDAYLCTEIV